MSTPAVLTAPSQPATTEMEQRWARVRTSFTLGSRTPRTAAELPRPAGCPTGGARLQQYHHRPPTRVSKMAPTASMRVPGRRSAGANRAAGMSTRTASTGGPDRRDDAQGRPRSAAISFY